MEGSGTLLGRLLHLRSARHDGHALVRALYLEVRRNLAVFEAVRLEDDPPSSEQLLATLAPLLSIDVLGRVLMPGPGPHAAYAQLVTLPLPVRREDDRLASASERLHSLWVRISALQAMATIPVDSAVLRETIQVRRRLRNVRDDYLLLAQALSPASRTPLGWFARWKARRSGGATGRVSLGPGSMGPGPFARTPARSRIPSPR